MFGYINADLKQLSYEDKKIYQHYFGELRRQLGMTYGLKGQLLPSCDLCFLGMLLKSIYEPNSNKSSKAIAYAADMNVVLSYHSLMGDYLDEESVFSGILARLLTKDYHRIKDKYPRQVNAVERCVHKLLLAAHSKESSLDIVSSYAGELLGELFNWKEDASHKSLYFMGYYMGKFVYTLGAYSDLQKDKKSGNYNPLFYLEKESPREFDTFVRVNLTSLMAECIRSFECLPITENSTILNNIVYSGVWQKYQYSLQKKEAKKKEVAKLVY